MRRRFLFDIGITFVLLLAASICFGQSELKEIPSFQDGLQPRFGRPITPNTAAVLLKNFYYNGEQLKLVPKWVQWSAAFDKDNRIRDLYAFYDKQTDSVQILCSVSDQVFYTADEGATFSRIGPAGSAGVIAANDSIFQAGNGSSFFHNISGSDNWRLYLYVGNDTVALDVMDVVSDDILVVEKNTYGDILTYPWVVTPIFDTTSAIDFETWKRRCFINDGVRETVKWTGSEFDYGHYIVDSAKVESYSYGDSTKTLDFTLLTPLSGSDDDLQEYIDYHYGVVYVYDRFPVGDSLWVTPYMSIVDCSSDWLRVYGDLVSSYTVGAAGMLYIVKPLNEGWAFHTDTLLTGTIDSIVTRDTIANPLMNLLTFYGSINMSEDLDSIDVDFTDDSGYVSVDSYQVILSYESDPDSFASKQIVKKIDKNTFRIVRPSWLYQSDRDYRYITIGVPDDAHSVNRDSTMLWQWGNDDCGGNNYKDVTLSSDYDDVDSFSVAAMKHSNGWPSDLEAPKVWQTAANTFRFTYNPSVGKNFSWVSVGYPASAPANSLNDSLLIQYGVDTVDGSGWTYFEDAYKDTSYGVAVCLIDSAAYRDADSTYHPIGLYTKSVNGFQVRAAGGYPYTSPKIYTWIAVGWRKNEPPELAYHLVYDEDVINRDSTNYLYQFNSPFYLFKLTDGVDATDDWWSTGTPCSYWSEPGDSLALRILIPALDYDGDTIPIPPNDSSQYAVLRLSVYPKAKSTRTQFQRMWFQVPPSRIYFSDLYDYNTISLVNFEDVGGDDDDKVMNFELIENQREITKTHRLYAQIGNNLQDMQTLLRSANFGSWCSGFHAAYLGEQFYLHKSGIFTYDASSPDITISSAVRPFFTDSMDLSKIERARAAIINDDFMALVASLPGYSENKTLLFDLEHSMWSTWADNMGCYLSRTYPGGMDSTLAATADDSAAIYVLRDTLATGNAQYISAFMDFDYPTVLKAIEKVAVTYEMEAGSWLLLNIYQDSSVTAVYTDSITSTTGARITEHHTFNIPKLREAIWFAVGLESHGADTCNIIPPISMKVRPIREDGGL